MDQTLDMELTTTALSYRSMGEVVNASLSCTKRRYTSSNTSHASCLRAMFTMLRISSSESRAPVGLSGLLMQMTLTSSPQRASSRLASTW